MTGGGVPEADFDMVAASLQADMRDAAVFFPVLCQKLADALPEAAKLEREPGLFKKHHPVRKITLRFPYDTFEAELVSGAISCRHVHFGHGVGGGPAFSKALDVNQWLAAVLAVLSEQAQSSATATAALRSLVT